MHCGAILTGMPSRLTLLGLILGVFTLTAGAAPARGAPGSEAPGRRDLDNWGKMGSRIRGAEGCYSFTYYKKDDKGRMKSDRAILEVSEKTPVYYDQPIRLEDLVSGDTVYILGRVVSREVRDRVGGGGGLGGGRRRGGKDQQIQNSHVLLTGKGLDVNEKYKSSDPEEKDVKWHKATVNTVTGGLSVTYDGAEYRVTLSRAAVILRRIECDEEVEKKLLKSGRFIHVTGDKSAPPPDVDEKALAGRTVYEPKRIVVFDARYLKKAYEAIFR